MLKFGGIWLAELVSGVGSSITGFVLGVWVYQLTGSETQLALAMFCAFLPGMVVAPFAGAIADRFDRRTILIVSDTAAAVVTAVLGLLIYTGGLEVWHIYLGSAVGSAAGSFQLTAYQAMTPLLIPKRHLARANGLMQTAWGAQIAAPLAAGALLDGVGLVGVLALDLASFAVALIALLLIKLPAEVTRPGRKSDRSSFGSDLTFGFRYLRGRNGLLMLVVVFAGFNFLFAMAGGLVRPLILSFTSATALGVLMFFGGGGLFVGSLVMGAWGGPRRKMTGVYLFMLFGGAALILHAPWPSAFVLAVAAPAFLFTLPIVSGCVMTILQTKTAPTAQGRVLSAARLVGQSAMPLAYLTGGPLAEHVVNPLLQPGGVLAGTVGAVVGVGPGRGTALIFLVDGALLIGLGAVVYLLPRLRNLETDLPDALPDSLASDSLAPDGSASGGSAPDSPAPDVREGERLTALPEPAADARVVVAPPESAADTRVAVAPPDSAAGTRVSADLPGSAADISDSASDETRKRHADQPAS
ncbi:MFS transporter [Sinosporangium siamense]|uniref:MFS transporter n=1 Tax=Sinosporangium siamense TaxID=1367973 RepID=A0A919RND6_9ACTN|nr:MFS transporter [Sinosporangium siamense]